MGEVQTIIRDITGWKYQLKETVTQFSTKYEYSTL